MASEATASPPPKVVASSSALESKHNLYIEQFLRKTLRVTVTDERVFVGQLKCTDKDCNLVLALTHEYRPPPAAEVRKGAEATAGEALPGTLQMSFTSRFVGLVVIPGEYITKIEWEEFVPP